MKVLRNVLLYLLVLTLIVSPAASRALAVEEAAGGTIYLPLVARSYDAVANLRRIHAPFFNVADITGQKFSEMAIFWFGRVSSTDNYTDVRVAYNTSELVIYTATFDRWLWYDTTPSVSDLTRWDSVSLYLDLAGAVGSAPSTSSYRFDAQLSNGGTLPAASKATYRGNGSGWIAQTVAFTAIAGWRGDAINNNSDSGDRGWAMTFRIPFSSLGVSAPPQGASPWGLALVVHDRDDPGGSPIPDQAWPGNSLDANSPSTWGQLRWGLPTYTPPPSTGGSVITVRHKLNGAVVPDAAVGGTLENQCPGDENHIWNQWGNLNYGRGTGANIQNQSDVADWPCFSKYYVTFPLNGVPAGKVIRSATLTLYHWGNSGPGTTSYVHVSTVASDWSETALTWNNAPLALENVAVAAVPMVGSCNWPCVPRTWDVSYAVAQAYAAGQPLRLALYSSDSGYDSGKYFTTSDAEDWNAAGRPTLTVNWGNP